jgi:HNH endonuclease
MLVELLAVPPCLMLRLMGYFFPACGEGLPKDEECPCLAADDGDLEDVPERRRVGRRKFTLAERIEIGERDNWQCRICQDPTHLVERPPVMLIGEISVEELVAEDVPSEEGWPQPTERLPRRPLSASIDHIVPLAAGGTDDRANLQLAHLFCNLHKNDSSAGTGFTRPEYVRAVLLNLIDGTPVPEVIRRGCFSSWDYPANRRVEFTFALYIAAGEVEADPRHGYPASRSERFIGEVGNDRWRAAVADMKERRAQWRARWQPVNLRAGSAAIDKLGMVAGMYGVH